MISTVTNIYFVDHVVKSPSSWFGTTSTLIQSLGFSGISMGVLLLGLVGMSATLHEVQKCSDTLLPSSFCDVPSNGDLDGSRSKVHLIFSYFTKGIYREQSTSLPIGRRTLQRCYRNMRKQRRLSIMPYVWPANVPLPPWSFRWMDWWAQKLLRRCGASPHS